MVGAQAGPAGFSQLFPFTAAVQPGYSGGPIPDDKGLLTRVVVSRIRDSHASRCSGAIPRSIDFAIQPDRVRSFVDRHGAKYHFSSSATAETNQGIATRVRITRFPSSARDHWGVVNRDRPFALRAAANQADALPA